MKKTKIKIPIYFGKLVIILVDKITDVNEKYNIDANKSYDSFTFQKTKNNSARYYIVLTKKTSFSVISHEVVHLVNFIFINNGIQLDRYNDEPQAYLHSWIFKQIEIFIKEC